VSAHRAHSVVLYDAGNIRAFDGGREDVRLDPLCRAKVTGLPTDCDALRAILPEHRFRGHWPLASSATTPRGR